MTKTVIDPFEEYVRLVRQVVCSYNHDYRLGYMEGLRRRYSGPGYTADTAQQARLGDVGEHNCAEFRRGCRDGFDAIEPQPNAKPSRTSANDGRTCGFRYRTSSSHAA